MTLASPVHLFQSSTRIIRDTRARVMDKGLTMGNLKAAITEHLLPHTSLVSLSDGMRQILFWNSIDIAIKQEIRSKISALEKLRDEQATAVGMIISSASFSRYETLERDVLNLVSTLRYIADAEPTSTSQPQSNHPVIDMGVTPTPQAIASIIGHLSSRLLHTQSKFREDSAQHSRPSKLTRWWPILIAGYFSSSTILQTVTNRREDILVWLSDALQTTRSFWQNWILEPIYQILAIIRHDKGSEVALISRRSLAADMDSLERMVVQFAQDNPQYANSSDTRVLQDAAREGDLTPVLRAYESNLKSPMRSVISGSLVRSLLIQIQKTKVDVEVAISGIDKLLKSQELVFGLLGISPAIAILWLLLRSFTTRKSSQSHFDNEEAKIEMIKILRRIDRDLCNDPHRESGLSYKTKGLVLCEVQLLKSQAKSIKLALQDSFLEDLHDMETECKSDAMKMQTILKRIHRSYLSN